MSGDTAIGFGTSGVRGLATGFTQEAVLAHVGAFLDTACTGAKAKTVWIGGDLRASTPHIASLVAGAVTARGWAPRYAGALPTPALAAYALAQGVPAIMVTGSHIPAQYNGLKFYRPDGELLKSDETPIREAAARQDVSRFEAIALPEPDPDVVRAYRTRFEKGFAPHTLSGLRIGVFEHSAAGRDLMVEILTALGARCVRLGRCETFVPVDTEAVLPDHMARMRAALVQDSLYAVVSTDGDGDRPLMLDEMGSQINGDVLGALAARALGAKTVVTPLTSTSAIEMTGWFGAVMRTRIGSPFVVETMRNAPGDDIVGFEANGGFLVQTDFVLEHGPLPALPTRDAVLPIIAVLAEGKRQDLPLSALAASLPQRVMKADRLQEIAPEAGHDLVQNMAKSREARSRIDGRLGDPVAIDTQDGTRLALPDGTVVHFRQSGNAPELRCYVETASHEETSELLAVMMAQLRAYLSGEDGRNGR